MYEKSESDTKDQKFSNINSNDGIPFKQQEAQTLDIQQTATINLSKSSLRNTILQTDFNRNSTLKTSMFTLSKEAMFPNLIETVDQKAFDEVKETHQINSNNPYEMLNKKNIVMISQLKRGQPSTYTSAVYKSDFKPSFNFRKNSFNAY